MLSSLSRTITVSKLVVIQIEQKNYTTLELQASTCVEPSQRTADQFSLSDAS